jgi:3-(3-hydroxy-phenyl)propionate hydroxylase
VRTRVAVVGAGPVGATVANYLGGYGIDTVVLERSEAIIDYPRAVGMDDECLRSIQGVGLHGPVQRYLVQNVPLRFFDARGRCFADIRPSTKEFGWYRRNIFTQPLLEQTLRAGLDRFPHVRLLTGHEVVGLTQTADDVVLQLRGPDGSAQTVTADLVVAADGGRSTVRELLTIPLEGHTHARRWVVIDADNDPIDATYTGLHCDPRRPYVCAHMPFGFRRWEFLLFPGEDADEMLSDDKVRELLSRHVADPSRINVVRARVYTHHSRLASTFVSGRVLLAGDAAHLMPPWAGQGFNTGLRDATNLSWKVAAVIQGKAASTILRTYDGERRSHAKAMIGLSTLLGRILSPTSRTVGLARDLFFRAAAGLPGVKEWVLQMRFKPMPVYRGSIVLPPLAGKPDPALGRMFIQPMVEREAGDPVLLDEVLGGWFAVLGFGIDPAEHLDAPSRKYLASLDTRFVKVVGSRPKPSAPAPADRTADCTVVEDLDCMLTAWFEGRPPIVVLRPDRYLMAVCGPAELGDVVARLREQLANGDA